MPLTREELDMVYDRRPVMKAGDMNIVGNLFGLKFDGDMVALYIEDDENYHYKCSFNKVWLPDLIVAADLAKQKLAE